MKESSRNLFKSTIEYSVQHDKKEWLELMNEFRKDVGEDFLHNVVELEELVDVYLLKEFLEKEPITIKIDEVGRKLEGSAILEDIVQNRHRVQTIFGRLKF